MRIVLLAPDLTGRSGWSRYALDLGKALHEQGHEIHCIVAKASNQTWCTEHAFLRQPTTYLNSGLLRKFDAWRVKRLTRKIQPDIIHVMAEPYALLFAVRKSYPRRLCMTIHGTYAILPLLHGRKTKFLFEKAYMRCAAVISVSEFTKNYLNKHDTALYREITKNKPLHVLPNAIDLSRFPFVEKKTAAPMKRIMSVSAVKSKKGYSTSVEAISLFLQKNPIPLRYDIFGTLNMAGEYLATLKNEIEELGLTENVIFHGSVDDDTLRKAYAEADLFLLPSLHEGDHFEGFGLVFLEANAYGVPVIGSLTGGVPEAISEQKSGYICDPYDAHEIAGRIGDILLRQTINRDDCRAWAEAHDVRKSAKELTKIYESLF